MDNKKISRHGLGMKIISGFLVFGFMFNVVLSDAWAVVKAPQMPFDAVKSEVSFNAGKIVIPENLGKIRDCYLAGSDKFVIHIQDAHCNYGAQHKIAQIIEYLNAKYRISTVNLEGGKGNYDLSDFTDIRDEDTREKIVDFFVKQGLVNGAEYYAAMNPKKVKLWGIENEKLYFNNLNAYRDSAKNDEEIKKHIDQLKKVFKGLKKHIYSPELAEIDHKYQAYKNKALTLREYLDFLARKSKLKNIPLIKFKNVHLLAGSLTLEESMDFKKVNSERDQLIDALHKILSKLELEELVVKTVLFRQGKISHKDFYAYLVNKSRIISPDLSVFPEFQKYVDYIYLYDSVDKLEVMGEIEKLENLLINEFSQNSLQKELTFLSRNLVLLENLFKASLTPEDYTYYKKHEKDFNINNYISFIAKHASSNTLDENIQKLDEYRKHMSKFYEYSFNRDQAFLKNLKFPRHCEENASSRHCEARGKRAPRQSLENNKPLTTNPQRLTTILVTGGFHSKNLSELFKKKDISYITILPEFKNNDSYESPYFNLLKGGKSEFQIALEANMSQIALISLHSELKREGVSLPDFTTFSTDVLVALQNDGQVTVPGKTGAIILSFNQGKESKPFANGITLDGKTIYIERKDRQEETPSEPKEKKTKIKNSTLKLKTIVIFMLLGAYSVLFRVLIGCASTGLSKKLKRYNLNVLTLKNQEYIAQGLAGVGPIDSVSAVERIKLLRDYAKISDHELFKQLTKKGQGINSDDEETAKESLYTLMDCFEEDDSEVLIPVLKGQIQKGKHPKLRLKAMDILFTFVYKGKIEDKEILFSILTDQSVKGGIRDPEVTNRAGAGQYLNSIYGAGDAEKVLSVYNEPGLCLRDPHPAARMSACNEIFDMEMRGNIKEPRFRELIYGQDGVGANDPVPIVREYIGQLEKERNRYHQHRHPFRFDVEIWEFFKKRLNDNFTKESWMFETVQRFGLAWTDQNGTIHYIDEELTPGQASLVWEQAMEAVNDF
ncbi:MAG: hypothetical protein ABH869_00430, partial [Candidatus Omnitrophota bacterium]